MDKYTYVMIPVNEKGQSFKNEIFSKAEPPMYTQPMGYVEILITKDQKLLLDTIADVFITAYGSKVYQVNRLMFKIELRPNIENGEVL